MADLSSASSSSEKPALSFPECSEGAFEDVCSICLEPFCAGDPATITSCKHEYHLQCILEWGQRSKECPICWQLLTLKDPAGQELLAAVESERCSRPRIISSSESTSVRFRDDNADHESSHSDDSDFDERIMQHLAAAASRARYTRRRERQRSSGFGPSHFLVFASPEHVSRGIYVTSPVHHDVTYESSDSDSPPFRVHFEAPSSVAPTDVDMVDRACGVDTSSKSSVLHDQTPADDTRRSSSSEMFSLPESIKSKFSATSARCKESISRSTRGIKDKLLARNSTVKELGKGVQREMSAGIAGFARMFERLDLNARRNAASVPVPSCTQSASYFCKGKSVEEAFSDGEETMRDSVTVATSCISSSSPGAINACSPQRGV